MPRPVARRTMSSMRPVTDVMSRDSTGLFRSLAPSIRSTACGFDFGQHATEPGVPIRRVFAGNPGVVDLDRLRRCNARPASVCSLNG